MVYYPLYIYNLGGLELRGNKKKSICSVNFIQVLCDNWWSYQKHMLRNL